MKSVKLELASIDKEGYQLGTSMIKLVPAEDRGRYRWKIEHEIQDETSLNFIFFAFTCKLSQMSWMNVMETFLQCI